MPNEQTQQSKKYNQTRLHHMQLSVGTMTSTICYMILRNIQCQLPIYKCSMYAFKEVQLEVRTCLTGIQQIQHLE